MFTSVPLPAVFRGVSRCRLPLEGSATFSGSCCLSCSCGGALSVGFTPCAVLFFQGLRFDAASPAARLPFGASAFSDTVYLAYCCAGGVGWAATLPLCSRCFSCAGWRGFCTLCQGAPLGVVTALWVAVWWCLLAPHSSSFITCSVISSCGSQPLWVLCSVWFTLP